LSIGNFFTRQTFLSQYWRGADSGNGKIVKITQEKRPHSQIALEIEIPPEQVKQAYEQVIKEHARSVKIPGFRAGKVPRQVLLQKIGAVQVKAAAVDKLVRDGVANALKEGAIAPLNTPELSSDFEKLIADFHPDSSLVFAAICDVSPQPNLSPYTGLTIEVSSVPPQLDQVDRILAQQQINKSTLIPVEDREAKLGDVAIIDYKTFFPSQEEGQNPIEISGGEAKDIRVDLDEERFIPGFVSAVLG